MRSNPTRASFQGAGKCNARPLPPRPAQPLPKPDHSRLAWRCLCRKLKADVPPTARRSQYTRPASRFKWLAGATGDRTPDPSPGPEGLCACREGSVCEPVPLPRRQVRGRPARTGWRSAEAAASLAQTRGDTLGGGTASTSPVKHEATTFCPSPSGPDRISRAAAMAPPLLVACYRALRRRHRDALHSAPAGRLPTARASPPRCLPALDST